MKPNLPTEAREPNTPRLALTLTDTVLWLTRYDPRGCPEVTYPVTAQDAAKAFRGFDGLTTGLLPENALFVERGHVAIYQPPQTRRLSFGRRRAVNLAMPGFVFSGLGKQYFIWAVTERPTTAQAALYRAPLPNVQPDGKVCPGNVQFPKCAPTSIHQAAQLFWESEFNDDLSENKVRAQERGARSLRACLNGWAGRRRFPADQLVRFGTLADVLKKHHIADDGPTYADEPEEREFIE